MKADTPESTVIPDSLIESVCARVRENKPVRRKLPGWGKVNIDRQLPFLCVYRKRATDELSDTERLVAGEASYIIALDGRKQHRGLSALVQGVLSACAESFGSALLVELWERDRDITEGTELPPPRFRIVTAASRTPNSAVEALQRHLTRIKLEGQQADVAMERETNVTPPGMPVLLPKSEAARLGCYVVGLEVGAVYHNRATGQTFPLVHRALHRGLTRALRRCFHDFGCKVTHFCPPSYLALGQRSLVKAVWESDRRLADIAGRFDLLLLASPVNAQAAWEEFKRSRFEREPRFEYRPRPIDPSLVKRELFNIPVERIEDPALAHMFLHQQSELEQQLSLVAHRGTKSFLYGCLQLFGTVDEPLMELATALLKKVPARPRNESLGRRVDARGLAQAARREVEHYRRHHPDLATAIEVRDDVATVLVSHGNLLIGKNTLISRERLVPLLHHEVGTHVVTYFNGRAQPLRQLSTGLPGYEELQEGLAVLAEYLAGGLTGHRLRMLAGRVVSVRRLVEGATFVEVFRELRREHRFDAETAFSIATRTFRGGGMTRPAIYLRGLVRLLNYLARGGSLEPLLVGKLGFDQINIIKELQWRQVLVSPPLRPRYLDDEQAVRRLQGLSTGMSVLDLWSRRSP